jgi:hypothetical protein
MQIKGHDPTGLTTARAAAGHDGAAAAAGAATSVVPTAAVKASTTAAIAKAAAATTPQHVQRLLLVHTHRLTINLHLSHERHCSGVHLPRPFLPLAAAEH